MLVCPTALHFIFFFSHFRGWNWKSIFHTLPQNQLTHWRRAHMPPPCCLLPCIQTPACLQSFPALFFFPLLFFLLPFSFFFAFYKGWFGELGNRNLQFWRELSVWHGCVGEYISWLGGLHIDKVSCFSFSFFPFFKIYTSGLYIIIYSPPF